MTKATLTKRLKALGAYWYEGNDQKTLTPEGHRAYRVKYNGIRYFYSLKEIDLWLQQEEQDDPFPFAVVRAHKSARMKAHGFYYYHWQCWDAHDPRTSDELPSTELSTEHIPIRDGYLRLIPLDEVAINATCCECSKTLHNADEIMEAIGTFKPEGWVKYELDRLQKMLL